MQCVAYAASKTIVDTEKGGKLHAPSSRHATRRLLGEMRSGIAGGLAASSVGADNVVRFARAAARQPAMVTVVLAGTLRLLTTSTRSFERSGANWAETDRLAALPWTVTLSAPGCHDSCTI
uniref:Uncharacterized protein n=1 Tax=Haptolina ericina TaxID=156174 RepID=A0A7S3EZD5_9EUKA